MSDLRESNDPIYKILIVEDERITADDLQICLESFGYLTCGPVDSGLEALKIVEQAKPDLALVDIRIKGNMDGAELGALLRKQFDIPFIYVTAFGGEETLKKIKDTEPSGYVVKPFNERELQTLIELALHRENSRRKREQKSKWSTRALSSIGEAVIATDSSQKIIFMNRAAELLTGWKISDAINKPLKHVLNVVFTGSARMGQENIAEFLPNYLTLARVNNALLQDRNSDRVPIDYTVTPITGDDQSLLGVIVVARDSVASSILEKDLDYQL